MRNMELGFVREMFETIAPRYDLLNRLLSLRRDVHWRRMTVRAARVPENGRLLDVACGTGDLALAFLKTRPDLWVAGIDFAPAMLALARKKAEQSKISAPLYLAAANAFFPPFPEQSFDAVTIAFGIRNIQDRHRVLGIFYRCLKPGGMVLVLELATPARAWLKKLYLIYFQRFLPWLGGWISKNAHAYQYLPDSVLDFPPPARFCRQMAQAGFSDVRYKPLTFGIATLYTGVKATDPDPLQQPPERRKQWT